MGLTLCTCPRYGLDEEPVLLDPGCPYHSTRRSDS